MGLFEIKQYKENSNIYQRAHHRYTINWDRIGDFFSDTGTLMQKVYGWGTAKLDTTDLLVNIAHLLQSFGAEAGVYNLRQKAEEQLVAKPVPEAKTKPMPEIYLSLLKGFGLDNLDIGLAAFGLRPTNTGGKDGGIGIRPFATGATKLKFPLFSGVTLEIDSSLDIKGGVVLLLRPDKTIEVKSGLEGKGTGTNVGSGRILMKLVHSPENSKPFEILSIPGGSSLTAKKAFIGGGAGLVSSNSFDILIEGGIEGAEFVFDPSKGDSFINKILPSKGFKSTFDLIFGWSRIGGLYFRGSASLEIKLPVHLSLGPIDIKGIYIRISLSKDGKIPIELSTSIAAKLGPLTVVVDRIGAKAEFDFPRKGGNLGPVNLDLGFKPPKGIGLSIDGGGFKGGGFLSFDTDNHRYTGVLELEFHQSHRITYHQAAGGKRRLFPAYHYFS